MSGYQDVYLSRVSRLGTSQKEIIENIQKLDFARNLKHSPNTEQLILKNKNISAIILTNKQDDSRVTLWMNTELSVDIEVGNEVFWKGEPWLVFKNTLSSNRSFNKSTIVKTNHKISWYNTQGILKEANCYAKSSMESIITENFRVGSAGVGIPMLQQTLQLIMPQTNDIDINQKVLIKGQGWKIIDYDNVSVDGLMYISLLEVAANPMVDNIADNIAGPLVNWEIFYPYDSINIENGATLSVNPIVYKDGEPVEAVIKLTSNNNKIIVNNKVVSGEEDESGVITILLTEYSEITRNLAVAFIAEPTEQISYHIRGKNLIKLTTNSIYNIIKYIDGVANVVTGTVSLTDLNGNSTNLATLSVSGNNYIVTANSDNLVGKVRLNVAVDGETIMKEIIVKPLW